MRNTLLKWALGGLCIFALVFAAAIGFGSIIHAQIDVTRTIEINRPPENVWWVLTDYDKFSQWHPQYRSAQVTSLPGEQPTRWRATYSDGRTCNFVVSKAEAPMHYAERITDTNLPFAGSWKLDLEPRGQATQVTAHSHVELYRPLDRLFVRLFVNPEREVEKILVGLKRRVEESR